MATNRRQESLRRKVAEAQNEVLAIAAGFRPPRLKATGLAIDEDDIRIRRERGRNPIFEHRDAYGHWSSMGIREDAEDADALAIAEARRRRARDRNELVAGADVRLSPLHDVSAYYQRLLNPGPLATVDEKALQSKRARALARIVEWFGLGALVSQVNTARFRDYIEWRTAHIARPGSLSDRTIAPSTAADDCRWLAAAINAFASERGSNHRVSVNGLPRARRREFHLDDATYRRLLVTLRRGWIWDEATGDWLTEAIVDPASGSETVRRVVDPAFAREGSRGIERGRMAQRALIVGHYTGMRPGQIPELGWTRDTERGWIDLVNRRVNQAGTKPRESHYPSGKRRAQNKNWAPVPMAAPFVSLARVWRAADMRTGATYVIQKPGGGGSGYSAGALLEIFKQGGERIGIERLDLCLHTMRHSCVTTLLLRNVPPYMVADFVDDDVRTIMKWYAHLGLTKAYVDESGKPVPIRNPLEALALRDRGPKEAKEARLRREAEEKALAAREARRTSRRVTTSPGARRRLIVAPLGSDARAMR